MRIILIGNYGAGNFGDEVLKDYFLETLRGHDVFVLSAAPAKGEYARLPSGPRSFMRFAWFKTLRLFHRCDAVVFGGGTLFTDIESVRACFLWGLHALLAHVCGKPYHLAFQGIGPFRTKTGRAICRLVLRHAASISLRDGASFDRVDAILKNKKYVRTFDPAILLFRREKVDVCSKNVLLVVPRASSGDSFIESVKSITNRHSYSELRVLSFQPDEIYEQKVCSIIQHALPQAKIHHIRSLEDLSRACDGAAMMLSARLHASLFALAAKIPFETVTQSSGDKHSQIHSSLRLEECISLAKVGERELIDALRVGSATKERLSAS